MIAELERREAAARLGMAHHADSEAGATTVASLAHYLGLTTVAAFVTLSGLIGLVAF